MCSYLFVNNQCTQLCINNKQKVIYPFHQMHYKNRNIGYRKKTQGSGVMVIRNHPVILFFQVIDLFGLYKIEGKLKTK